MSLHRALRSPRFVAVALAALVVLLTLASLAYGSTGTFAPGQLGRGLLAGLGLGDALEGSAQSVLILRLRRTLVALGVGASLAYSGALLQGMFRNALASPSVLGISTGATVGASIAILLVGGHGPSLVVEQAVELAPVLVTLCAFLGAALTTLLVSTLGTRGGRLSVPTLLLAGIAVNTCLGGLLTAMQSFALSEDLEVGKALLSWTFGSLRDHALVRVAVVWIGLGLAALVLPFVRRELDIFAGGEEDAAALGVNTTRVKWLTLGAASLATASAVAVAGQIAFLGLVVPHLLRLSVGTSHKHLLPLSLVAGAAFLLAADLGARSLLGHADLRPGVLMSLVGGPFFLFLLMRSRKELQTW
jgi:iron complex transport system permease protein